MLLIKTKTKPSPHGILAEPSASNVQARGNDGGKKASEDVSTPNEPGLNQAQIAAQNAKNAPLSSGHVARLAAVHANLLTVAHDDLKERKKQAKGERKGTLKKPEQDRSEVRCDIFPQLTNGRVQQRKSRDGSSSGSRNPDLGAQDPSGNPAIDAADSSSGDSVHIDIYSLLAEIQDDQVKTDIAFSITERELSLASIQLENQELISAANQEFSAAIIGGISTIVSSGVAIKGAHSAEMDFRNSMTETGQAGMTDSKVDDLEGLDGIDEGEGIWKDETTKGTGKPVSGTDDLQDLRDSIRKYRNEEDEEEANKSYKGIQAKLKEMYNKAKVDSGTKVDSKAKIAARAKAAAKARATIKKLKEQLYYEHLIRHGSEDVKSQIQQKIIQRTNYQQMYYSETGKSIQAIGQGAAAWIKRNAATEQADAKVLGTYANMFNSSDTQLTQLAAQTLSSIANAISAWTQAIQKMAQAAPA